LSERGPFGVHERPEPGPEPRPPAPPPPAPPARHSSVAWILGVATLLAIAYITLNTLRTEGPGSRGLDAGTPLPPFAMPLALSSLTGDANVATRPGSGPEGQRPACEVRGADVLNSCELAERGPVVLAFFAPQEPCEKQVDALEAIRPSYPDVAFAAVAIRGDRDEVRRVVREHGWKLPVGHDEDGAVANAYAVALCPTITFAYEGGRVDGTSLRLEGESTLRARVERLRRGP